MLDVVVGKMQITEHLQNTSCIDSLKYNCNRRPPTSALHPAPLLCSIFFHLYLKLAVCISFAPIFLLAVLLFFSFSVTSWFLL